MNGPCNCRPAPDLLWAIFDLDGCICDDRHRRGIADRAHAEKDPDKKHSTYYEYHVGCTDDPKRIAESLLLVAWRQSQPWHRVAIVSGRNQSLMEATETWLRYEGLYSCIDAIYMRPDSDRRPAKQVKAEIIRHQFLNAGQGIAFAMDDDPNLIDMYRTLGIPALRSYDL